MSYAQIFSVFLLSSSMLGNLGAQSTVATSDASFSAELAEATFDQVWDTVVERNWDTEFDEQHWTSARDELRPVAIAANDNTELRAVLHDLLGRLRRSHHAIIPADVYDDFEGSQSKSGRWVTGLTVRVFGGHAYVVEVDPTSDAFAKGIRPGWQLSAVRDKQIDQFIRNLTDSLSEHAVYRPETLASLRITSMLSGESHGSLSLTMLAPNGNSHELEVALQEPVGTYATFGHLPPLHVRSESKEVGTGVGYLKFNAFFAPVEVMQSLSKAIDFGEKGLVIDLRGNLGGLAAMTMGIGNRLVSDKKHQLGVQVMKQGKLNYVLFPGARSYDGPVAILIDECSISSAEILAGGLQAIGRARVFGRTSAGAALPSVVTHLPNGDYFQFAIADFVDTNGNRIEGIGVVPDVEVPFDVNALNEGRDTTLESAIRWIGEQK